MQDYTRLLVWQKSRSLIVAVSEASRAIRSADAPGLRSQLLRATMSISANIAEGAGRATRPDFARFLSMAIASSSEAEHHLTVASDLGFLESAIAERLIDRVVEARRMLFGLQRALLESGTKRRSPMTRTPDVEDSRPDD